MNAIPPEVGQVQLAVSPVCSFGYTVTRNSAQMMIELLGQGGDEAYDGAMQRLCSSRKLRCLVVVSQLMVHYI
jgi:hypothetical protein